MIEVTAIAEKMINDMRLEFAIHRKMYSLSKFSIDAKEFGTLRGALISLQEAYPDVLWRCKYGEQFKSFSNTGYVSSYPVNQEVEDGFLEIQKIYDDIKAKEFKEFINARRIDISHDDLPY